jgi:hypothetical protein
MSETVYSQKVALGMLWAAFIVTLFDSLRKAAAPVAGGRPFGYQAHKDDRVKFFECMNVVRMAERTVRLGKESEVNATLAGHCTKLPDDKRKEVCNQLVPARIAEIVKQLGEHKTKDFICANLGFAHGFGANREIGKADCEKIVASVKKEIAENPGGLFRNRFGRSPHLIGPKAHLLDEPAKPTPPGIGPPGPGFRPGFSDIKKRFLPDVLREKYARTCRDFEGPEKGLCHLISRLVHRRFSHEEIGNLTAVEACAKLDESKFLKLTL